MMDQCHLGKEAYVEMYYSYLVLKVHSITLSLHVLREIFISMF